jgi:phosphatidate phosphatase APP1
MDDYMSDLFEEAPEDVKGMAATPAANHLFTVSAELKYLNNATFQLFHHLTTKLLFLCKRSCPDIQTTMAFLTTQVERSGRNDYKKLTRVIKYLLRESPDLVLTLKGDDARIVKWWVDASF